jgi:hypothetical protein
MKSLFGKIYKRNNKKNIITIVSGLPRCGTSMMMQMLDAGGVQTVTDDIREADEDNPRGYYELEAVKKIKEDKSWLDDCHGKVFKMISLLLFNLPVDNRYKVVFMTRDMDEMIASQKAMLKRLNRSREGKKQENIERNFEKHLLKIRSWLQSQPNIDVIYMSYNDIVKNPYKYAKMLTQFLPHKLDAKRMAQVVEKTLYRQKKTDTGGVKN